MIQAATAFGGGVWARGKLQDIKLPQFRRAVDEADVFKLSVRVLSAAIPSLGAPGLVRRERPRIEIALGETRKVTEPGDFTAGEVAGSEPDLSSAEGAPCPPCPWRFGDTLTFAAHLSDLLGPGLQVWLRTASEVRLGPLQVDMNVPRDVGVCSVDIRKRVLPACVNKKSGHEGGPPSLDGASDPSHCVWESRVQVLPLADTNVVVSEASAHVTLLFSVTSDPEALLRAVDEANKPLADKMVAPFANIWREPARWTGGFFNTCGPVGYGCGSGKLRHHCSMEEILPPTPSSSSSRPASMSKGSMIGPPVAGTTSQAMPVMGSVGPLAPDLSPNGWVSHLAANGRVFWHHESLGPPPWQAVLGDAVPPADSQRGLSKARSGEGMPSGYQPEQDREAEPSGAPAGSPPLPTSASLLAPEAPYATSHVRVHRMTSAASAPGFEQAAPVPGYGQQVLVQAVPATHWSGSVPGALRKAPQKHFVTTVCDAGRPVAAVPGTGIAAVSHHAGDNRGVTWAGSPRGVPLMVAPPAARTHPGQLR
eukprot:TRINITY_DN4352_c0_g2_i1.p1 TRINITY_DN4352_c0_g2~~TRINITY_DN4352_c0_g2_i1.p1  ORF type:complete len:536 (-),score=91.35 TRINITY_DN4352_c0_g2_i1:97-1704(-)